MHDHREFRYTRLRLTALPLLGGIGDGSLSASDPEIQRRAALEAARMRRMFAEDSDVADPLAAGLAALIDVVERRGVVRYSVRGARAIPPPAIRRHSSTRSARRCWGLMTRRESPSAVSTARWWSASSSTALSARRASANWAAGSRR
ncbi:MAG: hypothetical protein ACRDTH_14355 [Pseudonocardiaceae bacterium]